MIILGLTGSIGMGKSTAARAFQNLGVPVFDSDAEVHALLAGAGEIARAVEAAFPGVTWGDAIDRKALGVRVFDDAAALKRLESILHPAVGAARKIFLEDCRARGEKLALLDVPLLFESGGAGACDYTLVMSAPLDVQRRRVLKRDGMTEDRLAAIIAQQMPDEEKRERADFIISTDRPKEETLQKIRDLVEDLRRK